MQAKQIKTVVVWSTAKYILYSVIRRHEVLLYIFFKFFSIFKRNYYIRFYDNILVEDHQSNIVQKSLFRNTKNIAENKCVNKKFQRDKNFYAFDDFKKDLLQFKISNTIDFGLIIEFLIWYHTLKKLFQERKLNKSVLVIDDLTSRSAAFLAVAKLYKKNVSLFVHQASKKSHCAKILEFCNLFTHMIVCLQKHKIMFGAKFSGNMAVIDPIIAFGSLSKKNRKELNLGQVSKRYQNIYIFPGKGAKLLKLIALMKSLRRLDNKINISVKLHPADSLFKYFILKLLSFEIHKELLDIDVDNSLFIFGNSTALPEAANNNCLISYSSGIDMYPFDENGYIASQLLAELVLSDYKHFINSFFRPQQSTFRQPKVSLKCEFISTNFMLKELNS